MGARCSVLVMVRGETLVTARGEPRDNAPRCQIANPSLRSRTMALDACCAEQALGDRAEHIPRRGPTMPDVEPYTQIISSMAVNTSLVTPATHSSGITF